MGSAKQRCSIRSMHVRRGVHGGGISGGEHVWHGGGILLEHCSCC